MAATPRHFLDLADHAPARLRRLVAEAARYKREHKAGARAGQLTGQLTGKTLGLVLERPSTRTRVSFEIAMQRLGGATIVLSPRDMQLGRGETLADTARVLGRFLDAIVLRTDQTAKLHELARHGGIPVINGLTPTSHPCQILADILTFEERRGPIGGRPIAWIGDGNNVATSWIEAAAVFGFPLRLATPPHFEPAADRVDWARANGADILITTDPADAVRDAAAVVTDTWISMSDDPNDERRRFAFEPYRVDDRLMNRAAPDAIFMHCLPAHRGEEVTGGVIDGPRSVVFDEAENRLYVQQAILAFVLDDDPGAPDEATGAPDENPSAAPNGGRGAAGPDDRGRGTAT